MKKIQILGTGCAKCKKLEENAHEAIKSESQNWEIEKITDIQDIMKFGIMSTPGLAVDGKVLSSGRLLNVNDIKVLLSIN